MVSIDFWNTLAEAKSGGQIRRNARLAALQEIAGRYIEPLSLEKIEEASRETARHFDRIWLNKHRTPTTGELVKYSLNHLNIPATEEDRLYLATKFADSMWNGPPELTDGVKETLQKLADQYSLAVISDTMYSPGHVIRKYLAEKEIIDYFQCFVFSDETGYSKPNPRAYKQALEQTGSKAADSWHIGDLLETDVTGAKNVGMQSVLFTSVSDRPNSKNHQIKPDHICSSWQEVEKLML